MKSLWVIAALLSGSSAFSQPSSPIAFIENKGQWSSEILFAANIPEGKLFLQKDGLRYEFNHIHPDKEESVSGPHSHAVRSGERDVLVVNFSDPLDNIQIDYGERLKTNYNFYYGSDQSKWASNCKAYAEVTYKGVYDGIDLRIYTKDSHSLKYDWIISQNQTPDRIKLKYEGDIEMFQEDGCAFIDLGSATIMEDRPIAFQLDEEGVKKQVQCSYSLVGKELSFALGDDYDSDKSLIIDPELVFSTFSGSVSDNFGYTACFDDEGSLYSGGIVFGPQFPATTDTEYGGGVTDIAILKYDSLGENLDYATFIGGSEGESPHSLIVNNKGELIIMGTTGSEDYPTFSNSYDQTYNGGTPFQIFENYPNGSDIVLSKLDGDGRLIASTFIGSPGNDGILSLNLIGDYNNKLIYNYGDYQRGDVIIDESDNIYVASSTNDENFPLVNPTQTNYGGGISDAVAFSFNDDLSELRWSTYLGGSDDDAAYSVKLTDLGETIVAGGTASDDFPITAGALNSSFGGDIDGFISIIDGDRAIFKQSTFLGTSSYDQVYFIDIDEDQSIYAAGQTTGAYPVIGSVYANPNSGQFIHKLSSDLSSTLFSTVFGSGTPSPNISITAFLANECGNIFLSGWGGEVNLRNAPPTSDLDDTFGLPVTSDAYDNSTDGSDFYLMVLSADGSELLYGSYFGSSNNGGDHVDGGTSRFDKRGIIYQSTCSCGGSADDFPTTQNAWSTINRGVNSNGTERCNNASFKFDLATIRASFQTSDALGNVNVNNGCIPFEVTFTNTSSGGEEFYWDFGNGVDSRNRDGETILYDQVGEYLVSLTVRDENTCTVEDVYTQTITIFDEETSISSDKNICSGASTQLIATGGASYSWEPRSGLDNPLSSSPTASPSATTEYEVQIVSPNGCIRNESVLVTVTETIIEEFEVVKTLRGCNQPVSFEFINNTNYPGNFIWDFGDGQISTETNPIHSYAQPGSYSVNLEIDENCLVEKTIEVTAEDLFVPNVITPDGDGINDYFVITSSFKTALVIVDRKGVEVFKSDDYQNDWEADGLPVGVYYYQATFSDSIDCKGWIQVLR